ncbi:MAG: hypothetical protein AAGA56_11350 [Myxococcota bacterium]
MSATWAMLLALGAGAGAVPAASSAPAPASPCRKLCLASGRCTATAAGCRATRVDDCRRSRACFESGACSLDRRHHACRVASDADCERSQGCRERGQCGYDDGLATCLGRTPISSKVRVIGGTLAVSGTATLVLTLYAGTVLYEGVPKQGDAPSPFGRNRDVYDAYLITSGVVALTGASLLLVSLFSTAEGVPSSGVTMSAQGLTVPFDSFVQ